MAEDNKMDLAKEVFASLCAALDGLEWTYQTNEDKLSVYFSVNGDDIPMNFIFLIDAERQLVRVMSPLPFKFSEDKRMEGAIATCAASFGLADGSFDYDIATGLVVFRMTATYRESKLSKELLNYMVTCATFTVDEYNDKLFAVDKGFMSIEDFIADC